MSYGHNRANACLYGALRAAHARNQEKKAAMPGKKLAHAMEQKVKPSIV